MSEPTVKTLIKIAEDIDKERGYGSENLATQIAVSEIITSIYEFNESPDVSIEPNAVLVTSCHGAKGLEFKYVILIADGFDYRQDKIEAERRLFYVAMTRAKEKLIVTHSQDSRFVEEAKPNPYPVEKLPISPPQFVFYADLTPQDINLGFGGSRDNQGIITQLKEGDAIELKATAKGSNWKICHHDQIIGLLSNQAVADLKKRDIYPGIFVFQPGEVAVRNVYHHLEINEVTGELVDSWYVVIPQIRICRLEAVLYSCKQLG
ncbi:MAG: ATP-dependent helicase [Oscillatoriales cyanobacterium SM2_2_1]|nr:ATP-dependent helicase [Oscillatoriales cyanobacterium SM2_2_1]